MMQHWLDLGVAVDLLVDAIAWWLFLTARPRGSSWRFWVSIVLAGLSFAGAVLMGPAVLHAAHLR